MKIINWNQILTNNFEDGIALVLSKLVRDRASVPASVTKADEGHNQLIVTVCGFFVDNLNTAVVSSDEKVVLEAANRALKSLRRW